MKYLMLTLALVFQTGCASNSILESSKFVELKKSNPFCTDDRPTKKFEVTFAIVTSVRNGIPMSRLPAEQSWYAENSEKLARRFFNNLAVTTVKINEAQRNSNIADYYLFPIATLATVGLYPIMCGLGGPHGCFPSDLYTYPTEERDYPFGFNLVRVSDNPLRFVICEDSSCEGIKEPFSQKQIKANKATGNFYVLSKSVPSNNKVRDYSGRELDAYSSAIIATGWDLNSFLENNYFPQRPKIVAKASEKIEGKWKYVTVSLDMTEACREARPVKELYTSN